MTDYTIDINADGVIDAQDDLDQDGDTDKIDQAQQDVLNKTGATEEEDKALTRFGIPKDYYPPTRVVQPVGTTVSSMEDIYYGGKDALSLVDANNNLVSHSIDGHLLPKGAFQQLYVTDVDAMKLLYNLNYGQRKELTDLLYAKGLYHGSKPSPSRLDKTADGTAVAEMLAISNQMGRTWDVGFNWITHNTKTIYGGIKVGATTPMQDTTKKLDDEAISILGRRLTKTEVIEAAKTIHARERAGDKTSLTTMAEVAVSKAKPELESANRFAKGVDIFRSMLGTG